MILLTSKNWACIRTFADHTHYVMAIALNPRDATMFASASLDGTVRLWNLESATSLHCFDRDDLTFKKSEGHSRGVNTVNFAYDLPYVISASDDRYFTTTQLIYKDYQNLELSNKVMYSNFSW